MDYEYYLNKLGCKYSLIRGEFVEDINGIFTVSTEFKQYSIYLNTQNSTCTPIAPNKSYLAREYKLRRSDCISLVFEWLDDNYKLNLTKVYKDTTTKGFLKYYTSGMYLWYEDNGFTKVNDISIGDSIIYGDSITGQVYNNHIGVCVGKDKILHHLPTRYSSIDVIDYNKVLGCYRYGN